MRRIKGQLTGELEAFIGDTTVDKAEPYPIATYRHLVECIAKLAYLNKDYLLFFRGQGQDFRNRAGSSTFYPTIYRGDYVPRRELVNRFSLLDMAAKRLCEVFEEVHAAGYTELKWKKYIQWSILQHYSVCDTPLLDLTQSLRVACSFAQMESDATHGYVYVFGLPYVTNRISHNSEHDLVNVRLLSICPPEALRPYFQEGYLAATEDITYDYDSKPRLDFKNRLIAKFRIPAGETFWGQGFSQIPATVLYPEDDRVEALCKRISYNLKSQLLPGQLGEFIQTWSDVESWLLDNARRQESRLFSVREAIDLLAGKLALDTELAYQLHELRKFRDIVVHEPKSIDPGNLGERLDQVQSVYDQLMAFPRPTSAS